MIQFARWPTGMSTRRWHSRTRNKKGARKSKKIASKGKDEDIAYKEMSCKDK